MSIRTLRHYDEVGLVTPSARSTGGFRLYTEADVERLLMIRRMKPLAFTLEEMAGLLGALDVLGGSAAGRESSSLSSASLSSGSLSSSLATSVASSSSVAVTASSSGTASSADTAAASVAELAAAREVVRTCHAQAEQACSRLRRQLAWAEELTSRLTLIPEAAPA